MYCENCGHKLGDNHLYCSECGYKSSNNVISKNSSSNKVLWIVLGCIFGIPLLIFAVIFFLTFFIIIDNTKIKEELDDYDISEYYDYEKINNSYIYNDDSIKVIKIKKF